MKKVSTVYATWRFLDPNIANLLWNCLVSIVQYRTKARENANLKKRNSSFFQKIKRGMVTMMYSQFILELSCFDCAISRESAASLCHKMSAYMNKKNYYTYEPKF